MRFVYLHIVLFGFWIIVNLSLVPGMPEFDPSLVILAMVASVEAIFLSTFILITQNRMSAAAEKRAELDLQISLLAEHEVRSSLRCCRRSPAGSGSRSSTTPRWRRSSATLLPKRFWTPSRGPRSAGNE